MVIEHTDFVTLRLLHILNQTSSNITQLLKLQEEEMKANTHYKEGWEYAKDVYKESKKDEIRQMYGKYPTIVQAPDSLHIALIAYSGSMYYDFNSRTREICSGMDIDGYQYKSFFKLLYLATETLGPEIARITTQGEKQ